MQNEDVWVLLTNSGSTILATLDKMTVNTHGDLTRIYLDNPFYMMKVIIEGKRMYHLMSVVPFDPDGSKLAMAPESIMGWTKAPDNVKSLYSQFLEFYIENKGDMDIVENPEPGDDGEQGDHIIRNGSYESLLNSLSPDVMYKA